MSRIVIVVETGSDISEELKKEYGIYTVPMHVTFGNRTKDDGTFSPSEICDYYEKTGVLPKTSASTPYDYTNVFERIRMEYPSADILLLGYSAATTGSFVNALAAKGNDKRIECVDTKNVSIGQSAVAVKTAKLIKAHPEWTLKQAAEAAKCVGEQTKMFFIPDRLDYLKAGGRIKSVAAFVGSLLEIKPLIELKNGCLSLAKKIRGTIRHTMKKIYALFIERYSLDTDEIWIGATTGFPAELKELAVSTAKEFGFGKVNWLDGGGVITTHGGPHAFGIAGYCKTL